MKRECPSGDALLAYAAGLLGEAERTELEEHLGSCERCRGLLKELSDLHRTLRAAGRERGPVAAERPDGEAGASSRDCPGAEHLAAYADGSLDRRRRAQIESHLALCAPCLAEVADLVSLAGAPGRDAPDRAVARVLARLDRERKTAVVRLAERSVELIRDFARARPEGERGTPFAPMPAYATARGARAPIRLRWSGDGELEVECEISRVREGAALTGCVTIGGEPSRATSVTLVTACETRGPESLDPRGRFGPWPLPPGESRLVLAGAADGGALELSIEVEKEGGGRGG